VVKAVVFDLDDTLISERHYIESGYHHISALLSKRLGKNENDLYQLLLALFIEEPRFVFNRLLDRLGVSYSKDTILELVEEYRQHVPVIEYYADVVPCVTDLKKKGIKTGIITDGYANAQRNKLHAVKAYDYFDEIIITDELGREYWKPHRKPFEIMRQLLNVEFNEMVYVGDNPEKDFYAGSLLRIKTIRIYREGFYLNRQYLANVREDIPVYHLGEICCMISKCTEI
jgi:putative hydrolase of the HAD superfamily